MKIESVLLTTQQIQERVQQLATEIEQAYPTADDLILLCVLKGSVIFFADLSRAIKRPHQLEFMAVSSYGAGTVSSGNVQIRLDLHTDIEGKHLLIVEDIVDTGNTLSCLTKLLLARNPSSLHICTLLDKPSRRQIDIQAEFVGFEIPDHFVVGYGLDYAEMYRNLPYVAILTEE